MLVPFAVLLSHGCVPHRHSHSSSFRGPAEELGVSNEVIFLSISLFVVGEYTATR